MGVRLAYSNLLIVSGVTISSSSEATGHPDDYMASPARWKTWRSATSTSDQWVKFDLGSNKSMTALIAIDAVLHSGGSLTAQAHTSDSWATPTISQVLSVPSPDLTGVLTHWFASQSLRWVRFYFTNTGAVSAYVQLGAGFAGTYLEPTISMATGVDIIRHDPSIQRRAVGGARSAVRKAKFHEIRGRFPGQSSTDRDNLRTVFNAIGASDPCICSLVPGTASLTFYGAIAEELDTAHDERSSDRWSVPFRFVEDVA